MYRSSPFRSTLNTGYIKLWTCVALDQCKLWAPFGHFCPYFHTPYTLLCPKDEFTFTFRRGLIWKIDNPSTTLSLAPGIFDNPYKGAESAGCQKEHGYENWIFLFLWSPQTPGKPASFPSNIGNFHYLLTIKSTKIHTFCWHFAVTACNCLVLQWSETDDKINTTKTKKTIFLSDGPLLLI